MGMKILWGTSVIVLLFALVIGISLPSFVSATEQISFGKVGDSIPIVGDWNGDGIDTVGTYQPSNSVFFLRDEAEGSEQISFGKVGDSIPIAGDWNGDGIDTVGTYQPSNSVFFLRDEEGGSEQFVGSLETLIPHEELSSLLDKTREKLSESGSIPKWVRNNAYWWSENQIKDSDFVAGMQYLVDQKIMIIPTTESGTSTSQEIPDWIRNNAGWWAHGLISDDDFVSGIQYLISNGIMVL